MLIYNFSMFFQLLYIHLFRPFLKYSQQTSPLPPNVSPRRLCTQAAAMISKLMRLYRRSHGLRQICNVAVRRSVVQALFYPDLDMSEAHYSTVTSNNVLARSMSGIARLTFAENDSTWRLC